MIKKHLIRVVAVILVILLLSFVFELVMLNHKAIPILKNFYFGMNPIRAGTLLGKCYEREYSDLTGKVSYEYKAVIFGHDATVYCDFLPILCFQMTDVSFIWEDCDQELYDQIYSCMYEYYCDHENFSVKTRYNTINNTDEVCFRIDNGATGLFFDLGMTEDRIYLHCTDLS